MTYRVPPSGSRPLPGGYYGWKTQASSSSHTPLVLLPRRGERLPCRKCNEFRLRKLDEKTPTPELVGFFEAFNPHCVYQPVFCRNCHTYDTLYAHRYCPAENAESMSHSDLVPQDGPVRHNFNQVVSWVKCGECDKLIAALEQDRELIRLQDQSRKTLLHYACEAQQMDMIMILIHYGADAFARDGSGVNPINVLASAGRLDILREFEEAGIDWRCRTDDAGESLEFSLIEALKYRHVTIDDLRLHPGLLSRITLEAIGRAANACYPEIECLIDLGIKLQEFPVVCQYLNTRQPGSDEETGAILLRRGVGHKNHKFVGLLMEYPRFSEWAKECDDRQDNLLHAAVRTSDIKMMQVLGSHKDFDTWMRKGDRDGYPPLIRAVTKGDTDMVSFLSKMPQFRSWACLPDAKGNTPLHIAIEQDDKDMVGLLAPLSDQGLENKDKKTPVQLAQEKSLEYVRLLDSALADHLALKASIVVQPTKETAEPVEKPENVEKKEVKVSDVVAHHKAYRPDTDMGPLNRFLEEHQYSKGLSYSEMRNLTIEQNDFDAYRCVINGLFIIYDDSPIASYGSVTFLTFNDDKARLARVTRQFAKWDHKAYFTNFNKGADGRFSLAGEQPIITGRRPITSNSLVAVNAHGPKIGDMSGAQFAEFIHQWLLKEGCQPKDTPKITFQGCKVAAVQQVRRGYFRDKNISFASEFVEHMASLRRYPMVTASRVEVKSKVEELCVECGGENGEVKKWQGSSVWLDQTYAKARGMHNITRENYDPSLIQRVYFKRTFFGGRVVTEPKYKLESGEPEEMKPLYSMMHRKLD